MAKLRWPNSFPPFLFLIRNSRVLWIQWLSFNKHPNNPLHPPKRLPNVHFWPLLFRKSTTTHLNIDLGVTSRVSIDALRNRLLRFAAKGKKKVKSSHTTAVTRHRCCVCFFFHAAHDIDNTLSFVLFYLRATAVLPFDFSLTIFKKSTRFPPKKKINKMCHRCVSVSFCFWAGWRHEYIGHLFVSRSFYRWREKCDVRNLRASGDMAPLVLHNHNNHTKVTDAFSRCCPLPGSTRS